MTYTLTEVSTDKVLVTTYTAILFFCVLKFFRQNQLSLQMSYPKWFPTFSLTCVHVRIRERICTRSRTVRSAQEAHHNEKIWKRVQHVLLIFYLRSFLKCYQLLSYLTETQNGEHIEGRTRKFSFLDNACKIAILLTEVFDWIKSYIR